MEFIFDGSTLHIDAEKKRISLSEDAVILDGMLLEMPWEYEKWGFLSYVAIQDGLLISQFRVEGNMCAYIPVAKMELSSESLEFLGDVDILILPGTRESIPMIEQIEPRLVVAYGSGAHEIGTQMGVTDEPTLKRKLKETDLSPDKTNCIILA